MPLLHGLRCGGAKNQQIGGAGEEHSRKWYQHRPSVFICHNASETDVLSEILATDTQKLLSGIGCNHDEWEDGLQSEEDREDVLLESGELWSRKAPVSYNTANERLEQCGT